MAGPEPANAKPDGMADQSRLERRLDRMVARATTPRGATVVIASLATVMTVGAGLLMTLVDDDNFPSIGSGLWWAVQTVTTVGYGDTVPTNLAGRLVAALVMLLGIGFLTVITVDTVAITMAAPRGVVARATALSSRRSRFVASAIVCGFGFAGSAPAVPRNSAG